MQIIVWDNFTKRKNSTLRPAGGTTVTCVLKEQTSVENPVFILNTPLTLYTYVGAFGHYYFVSDIVNLDGQIKIPVSRSYKALFKESVYLIPVLES